MEAGIAGLRVVSLAQWALARDLRRGSNTPPRQVTVAGAKGTEGRGTPREVAFSRRILRRSGPFGVRAQPRSFEDSNADQMHLQHRRARMNKGSEETRGSRATGGVAR